MSIVINGRIFKSSDALVYGDYVGAGSVGVANVRWLEGNRQTLTLDYRADPQYSVDTALEHFITAEDVDSAGAIILRGDFGYRVGYILTDVPEGASEDDETLAEDGRDVLDAITEYGVIDEGLLYEVEEEWRQECLSEIWKYEAPRALAKLDAEAGRFVDHMTEGEFNIMWYEAVELPGRVEWIYEENQAVPYGLNKAVPALLEWIRDRFAELEQQAGTLGWSVTPENPGDLANTEWGYAASIGGMPNKWFAHRWQALESAVTDMSFRDVQPRLI